VHEKLDLHHPTGSAKYLENPTKSSARKVGSIIAASIRRRLRYETPPMADINVLNINDVAGTAIPFVAATITAGDKAILSDDRSILLVNNGSGSSVNLTLDSFKTVQGLTVPARVVACPATTIKAIPLYRDLNANPADSNKAHFVCSAVTSVTLAVIND
jgi:hypothetical protein